MPTIILPALRKTAKRNDIRPPRTRSKCVIRKPSTNATASSSQHAKNLNQKSHSQSSGLVIVIPPKRRDKRAREQEDEDGTLVALDPDRRVSKRSRRAASYSSDHLGSSNDDETLVSPALTKKLTRKPKSTTRSTPGKRHPTVAAQQKPCSYTGHFNLYAMDHQDLCEIYRPAGSSKPRYEVLYRHLRGLETSSDAPVSTSTSSYASPSPSPAPFPRFSQNDPELETETCVQKLTATITLPPTPYGRKFGSAHAPCLHDPVTHHPYPLELTRISPVNQVFYRDAEKECFATRHSDDVSMVGKLPGVSARVGVCVGESDVRRKGKTGVLESAGGFHMSRVWEGVDANADTDERKDGEDREAMELFEGYMGLRVSYGREYERMGYGRGVDVGFAFWAVREMKP